MSAAFGTFAEPHAWLIRGLVEYGWPDATPVGGRVPAGRHGAIELQRFRDSGGRDGVHLLVPAVAGGQWCQEDGVYDFSARIYRADHGGTMIAVRCVEANFLQEFPFDPNNPLYAAGYVHQAIAEYVPSYVQWRLSGGELTWAQRQGLPEIAGEGCSQGLVAFIDAMIRQRRGMDSGPTEGWWPGQQTPAPPQGHAPPAAPSAAQPIGPIAVAGRAGKGHAKSATEVALEKVRLPARLLTATSGVLAGLGALSLLNAFLTLVLFQLDRMSALGGSGCFGVMLLAAGGLSVLGARRLGKVQGGVLPWIAMGTNLALPLLLLVALLGVDIICCGVGAPLLLCVPAAIWSLYVWTQPAVVQARAELAGPR